MKPEPFKLKIKPLGQFEDEVNKCKQCQFYKTNIRPYCALHAIENSDIHIQTKIKNDIASAVAWLKKELFNDKGETPFDYYYAKWIEERINKAFAGVVGKGGADG